MGYITVGAEDEPGITRKRGFQPAKGGGARAGKYTTLFLRQRRKAFDFKVGTATDEQAGNAIVPKIPKVKAAVLAKFWLDARLDVDVSKFAIIDMKNRITIGNRLADSAQKLEAVMAEAATPVLTGAQSVQLWRQIGKIAIDLDSTSGVPNVSLWDEIEEQWTKVVDQPLSQATNILKWGVVGLVAYFGIKLLRKLPTASGG